MANIDYTNVMKDKTDYLTYEEVESKKSSGNKRKP